MKAALLKEYGTTPVYVETETPTPKENQQLITVKAAPLKNLDRLKTIADFYGRYPELPAVTGTDGVGLTQDGKRIYAFGITGMFAEKALVSSTRFVAIPNELDWITAAALPNAVMGAVMPMRLRGNIKKGDRVIINGATGFTGQLAVQAAAHYGASEIIVTGRSEERLKHLLNLGATKTVSLTDSPEDISRQLDEILKDAPADIVMDYLWGKPAELILESVSKTQAYSARFINIGNNAGNDLRLKAGIIRNCSVEIMGAGLGSYSGEEFGRLFTEFIPEIYGLAAKEKITIQTLTQELNQIEKAWNTTIETGKRLVLTL